MQILVTSCALASRALASPCNDPQEDGMGEFNVADGQALKDDVLFDRLNPSLPTEFLLKANHQQNIIHSTAKACIVNSYWFENTHVALSDVADGLNSLLVQCGSAGLVSLYPDKIAKYSIHDRSNKLLIVANGQLREILV